MCEQLIGVLTGRIGKSYIAQLTREMKEASDELEFEKAARLRDQIQMLSTVVEQNAWCSIPMSMRISSASIRTSWKLPCTRFTCVPVPSEVNAIGVWNGLRM